MLFACHPERPNDVISEGKMERILYDYHLAQAMAEHSGDSVDYRRYVYVQKVFEKYGITEAEFDTSMVWYSANAGYLHNIYKRLHDRLTAEATAAGVNQANNAYVALTANGDTANIWTGPNMVVMLQGTTDNHYAFVYTADTSFHRGDQFVFHATSCFLQRDGQREAVAGLSIRYRGDSVVSQTRSIHGDADFEMKVVADTSLSIKSVHGFVYYPTYVNNTNSPRRLFLLEPVLVRIHRRNE